MRFVSMAVGLSLLVCIGCRDPLEYEDETAESQVTIIEIQTPHSDDEHPVLGGEVFLRSVVVTAYDSYSEPRQSRESRDGEYVCLQELGYAGAVIAQDYEGGVYSGISLFNPTLVPAHQTIGPGDLVDIRGEYLEFCLDENNSADSYCDAANTERLSQLGGATVTRVGEASAPEPIQISSGLLGSDAQAEPYEGVLVTINERLTISACTPEDSRGAPNCCVGDYDRYGNLQAESIQITNEFYSIPEGTRCVESVTGIVTWFFEYKISPRGPNDVVIPDQCRADG